MFYKILMGTMIFSGFYTFVVIFSLIRMIIIFPDFDELEKKIFYETLSFSMGVVLILHFFQLIISMIMPLDFRPIISSGGHSVIRGIDGSIVHFDSFLFDCVVIAIIYNSRRLRYGLITKKMFLLRNLLPMLVSALSFLLYFLSRFL